MNETRFRLLLREMRRGSEIVGSGLRLGFVILEI